MRQCLLIIGLGTMLFGRSQNVGIGTSSPTRGKFEVFGAVGSTSAIFSGGGVGISFQRNSPAIGYNHYYDGSNHRYIGSGSAFVQWLNTLTGSLNFDIMRQSGTPNSIGALERVLTISNLGNVSFDTTEVNASLAVGGQNFNISNAGSVRFQGTKYHSEFNKRVGTSTFWTTAINGGLDGSSVYINDQSSGPVFITTAAGGSHVGVNRLNFNGNADNASLDIKQVNGRGFVLVEPSTFHNWEFVTVKNLTLPGSDFYVYYNGTYKGNFFHVDGTYSPISDIRLKKNVTSLISVLDKVMQLRPVTYYLRHDASARKQLGFVAQAVEELFPELVERTDAAGTGYESLDEVLTLNYDGISPILIKAIQEQQKSIQALKDKNEELKSRINEVQKVLKK